MEPKPLTAHDVAELKKKLLDGKNLVVAQQAKVDQLRLQLEEADKQIRETYGLTPEQLGAEFVKAEAEIHSLSDQILSSLSQAGL